MKTKTTIRLILAALTLAPLVAWAQTTPNPPGQISYQGFLTDASGIPLATNTPRNYTVTFRIYDASTGGNEKWAEQQVVTVDRGYFTVLLGNGSAIDSNFTNDLTSVFSGPSASDRYLGMTVAELGGNEIAPRLRLLASPYALLARNANALISPNGASLVTSANGQLTVHGTINGNGSGLTALSASALTGTLPSARLSGTYSSALNLANSGNNLYGNFYGNGAGLTSLNASQLKGGTLPDGRLSGNVAMRNVNNNFSVAQSFASGGVFINGNANGCGLLDVNGCLYNDATVQITARSTDDGMLVVRRSPTATGGNGPSSDAFRLIDFVGGSGFGLEVMQGYAAKPGGGSWSVYSDARLKHDVKDLHGSLDKLLKLRSVTFEYNDVPEAGGLKGTQMGFIAQEVEKVFPEWVQTGPSGYKMLSIKGFEALTVQALRELRAEKDAQLKVRDERIAALEQRLTELEAKDKARDAKLSATQDRGERAGQSESRPAGRAALEQKAGRVEALEREVADLKRIVVELAEASKGAKQAALAAPQTLPSAAVASLQTASATVSLDR